MERILVIILFFSLSNGYAQDISGIWKGKVYAKDNYGDTTLVTLEIEKAEPTPGKLVGSSICSSMDNAKYAFHAKSRIEGSFDAKSRKYSLEEKEVIETSLSKKMPLFFDRYLLSFPPNDKNKLSGKCLCINNDSVKKKFPWATCHEEFIVFLTRSNGLPVLTPVKKTRVVYDTVWVTSQQTIVDPAWGLNKAILINEVAEDRLLEWNDFKGEPSPDSSYAAMTYWKIKNDFRNIGYVKDTVRFNYYPSLVFENTKSWIKNKYQTNELLNHEQMHFNIGKLCLLELYTTMKITVFLKNNFPSGFNQLYAGIKEKYDLMDKQYDVETKHGEDKVSQAKWDVYIISELGKYKSI
jgi:hypothetical protein